MPLTFVSLDNEFVTSTGSKIDNPSNKSFFDTQPEDSTGLVVHAQQGDSDPRLFEVGDTYDLTWDGASLQNAAVVESEDTGGTLFITFEGVDATGTMVQLLWSPGFDLQEWSDNTGASLNQMYFTSLDTDANNSARIACFAASTRISVPGGTIAAGDLRAGDWVETLDSGPMRLQWTGQQTVQGGRCCMDQGMLTASPYP